MTTYYIQRKDEHDLETMDEVDMQGSTTKEILQLVQEYRLSDPSAEYYVSCRCCKAWKEEK